MTQRPIPLPLSRPINAWGTPTRYGVSRSSEAVAAATAATLRTHVDMDLLQRRAAEAVMKIAGTPAACFCHCAAAGLVLAVAGSLSGDNRELARQIPRHSEEGVTAIQAEHCVDYGQPIVQTLRLTGSHVRVLEGSIAARETTLKALAAAGTLRAVVHVESLLATNSALIPRTRMATLTHRLGARFIVDAAAQDWRMGDKAFVGGADITIFSGQKYLAAPTCGLLVGARDAIAACEINLHGIGRPMKPTKEALAGLLAAIQERDWLALPNLRRRNLLRALSFAEAVNTKIGMVASVPLGPEYGPYPRVLIDCGREVDARNLANALLQLSPPIVLGPSRLALGEVTVELTHVNLEEETYLLSHLEMACTPH